jgi:hypothetical protein
MTGDQALGLLAAMTAAATAAVLAAVWLIRRVIRAAAWAWRHAVMACRQPRRRPPRPRPATRQARAAGQRAARDLAFTIATGTAYQIQHPPPGFSPGPGETLLHTTTCGYATCSVGGWADHGKVRWLITTARLAARLPSTGQLTCLWWHNLTGLDADPAASTITLRAEGRRDVFYGPGAAPVAIAAITARLGPAAMATEPALAWLSDPQGNHQQQP